MKRRKFLVRSSIGVGVILGTGMLTRGLFKRFAANFVDKAEPMYVGDTSSPGMWFEISADNKVLLHSPKVEMGQGTFTGLAQIAADELEVPFEQMQVKHASSASGNVDGFGTGGSTSISGLWNPLRELAATMREMLRMEGARQLGIDVSEAKVTTGTVTGGGKSLTYGEIVANVVEWTIPDTPALKEAKEYKIVGQPVPRVDLKDKVMGAPIFGMDASMPGMVYGAVARPTTIGSRYIDADTSVAEGMPGVIKVVKEKEFVGVVANSYTEAENAKNALIVSWDTPKKWQGDEILSMIEVGKGDPTTIQRHGNSKKVLESDGVIRLEYRSPMGAHAQIEPNGAVAFVEENRATIKMSTQVVDLTRKEVASRLGLAKDQVDIQPTFLGGGFGRRLHTPNAIQAALLSKHVGKPVKCFLNRQEEFQHDTFRPPTHHVLKAKLTDNGSIEAMEHNVASGDVMYGSALLPPFVGAIVGSDVGAWRGGMIHYGAIPKYKVISWQSKLPFATSWWRALGLLANTFAIESFMDELALEAGKDPIQFRLDHIQDDDRGYRLKEVIKAVRQRSEWQDGVVGDRAMGFACSTDANTPVAQVAEVSVTNNRIQVHKVTCAMDPGLVVNPDQVRAQIEGCIIMGMSASMFEEMKVKDGQLEPIIYGPYEMATLKDAPKEIDVVLLQNSDVPGAVGEPPIGPIGAAIANAVVRLTGQRLREMPLKLS